MQIPSLPNFPRADSGSRVRSGDQTTIGAYTYTAQSGDYDAAPQLATWAMSRGTVIDRMETHLGDTTDFDGGTKERAEWACLGKYDNDTVFWLSYSMYVPPFSDVSEYIIVGQLHGTKGVGDVDYPVPIYCSITPARKLRFSVQYTAENPVINPPTNVNIFTESDVIPDAWVNYVHKVKCNAAGAGLWQVWRNGAKIVEYSGPLGSANTAGDYWKYGIYRASKPTNKRFVVWYANMENGTTDLSDRITSPLSVPTGLPF